jgi:copper transport protein
MRTGDFWLTGAERAVLLAGLSIALGGLAGRGLARHYRGARPASVPGPWAVRGSLLGLAACLALLVTALAGPTLAAGLAQPAIGGLRSGGTAEIALVQAACFILALLWLRAGRTGTAAFLLCGVVIAEGIRAHPDGVIPVAGAVVTYCHVFPAVLWAGMLVYAIRAAVAWRADPAAVRGIVGLYSTAAGWLFGAVVVSGVVSALILVPVASLLSTAYGLFLIAKAALVCVAAGLALAGRAWLRRQPAAAGGGPATVTKLELAALAAVLALTGILTVLTPPARPITTGASQQVVIDQRPDTTFTILPGTTIILRTCSPSVWTA